MNIILSIYSEDAFKEYPLPSFNNADYLVMLHKEFFHLNKDLRLNMEVMDEKWRIKKNKDYDLERNSREYEEEVLEDNDVINLSVGGNGMLSIIVKYVESVFNVYEKYRLDHVSSVSIGKESNNDIQYDYLRLVSRDHAVIEKTGHTFKIINKSLNGIYVNSHRVDKEEVLPWGAYINIMGLHMVFLGTMLAIDTAGSHAVVLTKKLIKYSAFEEETVYLNVKKMISPGKTLYHRAPRSMECVEEEAIEIEAPPELNFAKKQPLYMTIGPSVTMALPMLLGCMLMIYSSGRAQGSSLYMYSGLIMSVSSAAVGVGWALANIRYQKKEEKQEAKNRFDAYGAYLIEKTEEIKQKYTETSKKMTEMYPDASGCLAYDESRGILWNRNATHKDFLKHRLGTGQLPFEISIDIPKKRFRIYKDELAEKPAFIKENYDTLYDVPITIDLKQHTLIGLIGGKEKQGAIETAKCIAAQIAANNCYTDVKMGFVFDKDASNEADKWKFAKWLPHVWSEDKKTRYIASDELQTSDMLYELTKIFRSREEEKKDDHQVIKPYYILFLSNPKALEGELLSKYIFDKEMNCGLTTIFLTERYEELPNACGFVIENTEEFHGMYEVSASESRKQNIVFDRVEDSRLEEFSRHLSALEVQEMETGGEIPSSLTFFEMLKINRPKDLPIKELWAKNRTYDNIRGMIGQKSGGTPCYLDVHEKYHGPHGLVAGTTGSGKSETLQTYMMSLAVNYSPDDIGFFIIDYKGGGMANLFSGLPHMVGSISNLSGNQVRRAMISIKSENRRRQRVFTEHGVNNINLYTKLVKNGEASLPVPHLFIIIDEFAELKKEEPDFMRELISVAQVGRSLGVHLILATQKPNGTVDDNILSNSKFRLCLRVQDRQDSNDMLHKPDAAYITQAGRCYLQVGNDEVYELFQSGYSGASYEEDLNSGNTEPAKLLHLNGKVDMTGNSIKLSCMKKIEYAWIENLKKILEESLSQMKKPLAECLWDDSCLQELLETIYQKMWERKLDYPASKYNSARLEDFIRLYQALTEENGEEADVVQKILDHASDQKIKLPQKKEKTQLDAVKEHLAAMAKENGYQYHLQLWMPVLGSRIYLDEFAEYRENRFQKNVWPEMKKEWSLDFVIGKWDDPENQNQMPFVLNFAEDGHMAVIGSIVSGRSTMMQTMAYALVWKYSPETVNLYALDFSSKMMSSFEEAPHVGGIMYESDLDKIAKFFNMMHSILEDRKKLFGGGNYSQYVQVHGVTLPAVVIFIDNYASFKEKTEESYEDLLIRISKEGVSHGIFLVVSGSGFGMNDITARVGENIGTTLCLALQDKFAYIDLLHNNQIEVMPENGIRGRGLALYGGRVLEYQTALAIEAENDYKRMEKIRAACVEMKQAWKKKAARRIPEIPKKPVWSAFCELEEYQKASQTKEKLPVGYDAANAQVYGIDLKRTYCYLIMGTARSGKTNFLKVCLQAAMEKECRICVIDSPALELRNYQKEENVAYAAGEEDIFAFFQTLLPIFKERNVKKNQLLNEDYEEEEIFDEMSKEIPYFIFISDLSWFVPFIYHAESDMRGFLENIIAKGRLHNIYFISDLAIEKRGGIAGYQIYESFAGYKTGIHFGGKTIDNPVFNFDYLSFAEKARAEAPGVGTLPDIVNEDETAKIVVPLARR